MIFLSFFCPNREQVFSDVDPPITIHVLNFSESVMNVTFIFPMKFCSFTIHTGAGLIVPEIQDDGKLISSQCKDIEIYMHFLL